MINIKSGENGPHSCRLRKSSGFTLIEAMLSVALSAFSIVSVGLMLDNGIRLATDNRSRLYCVDAMRTELTALRQMNFDTMAALNGTTFTNTNLTNLHSGTGTIAVASGLGSDNKKVTLTVSWTRRSGQTLTQSFTTYISRKGLNGS